MRCLIAAAMLLLAACNSETGYGKCIGAFDDPDPALRYETSGRNVVIGLIGVETVIIPAWVIIYETRCPIARRPPVTP